MLEPRNPSVPEVWAPSAAAVSAVVDGQPEDLRPIPGRTGWWSLGRELSQGQRYAFSVDGGPPLPDPRSLAQPEGVHGPSAVADPAIFGRAPGWAGRSLRGAVGYELHIGTFTDAGTFDSAIERLDHLVGLGVEYVEVMPVAPFPGERGWGYDGVALYGVHHAYGGPEAFARFIDAAHERGLAVVLDVVFNHLGPEGNYLSQFGPYFTTRHHTPWGDALNLDDEGNQEVRAFLLGAARQWLVDFQVDGLRLDAVHELADDSEPHFLAELAGAVDDWERETGRPMTLIAESDLNRTEMVSPLRSVPGARGMDAQWADDVHHALHAFFTGETHGYYVDFGTADVLAKALTKVFIHDGGHSTFRGTDWGAPVDRESDLYDGHSFVTFTQDHDQVGNRAVGDRLAHVVDPGLQAAAAALNLLSAFGPMLFMGEEWADSSPFPYFSHLGPELGPKVTEGRAREFAKVGWAEPTPDPQAEETFRSAVLRWEERQEEPHARMLSWYRRLIGIRHREDDVKDPALTSTRVEVVDENTVVMWRGRIGVAATRAADGAEIGLGEDFEVLAAWDEPADADGGDLRLRGPGAVVVRLLT
ncbi:malto-oligosyltrehalose trehalohydrolase [Tessaracoccus sp. OS52]|uniref:malto-oligosyltrehalose trehalohydrolase n=1 Tax=Tessaracoccus sp. OS52 TaxID=2886691 RepID=UPI001D11244B|nr:malto-oligosyltrehalose trehalohydrolase [Tessaracoccus sp. OS52]MCC2593849.1 malto-oligosyltrehalose trehalohydrolase [Tessaracoccus sp. OS52]